MDKKEIKLDGVAGVICVRCYSVVLVFVHDVNYTAKLVRCPAVNESGYFCEAPMRTLDITEIDNAVASYHALNLAGQSRGDSDGDGDIGYGFPTVSHLTAVGQHYRRRKMDAWNDVLDVFEFDGTRTCFCGAVNWLNEFECFQCGVDL